MEGNQSLIPRTRQIRSIALGQYPTDTTTNPSKKTSHPRNLNLFARLLDYSIFCRRIVSRGSNDPSNGTKTSIRRSPLLLSSRQTRLGRMMVRISVILLLKGDGNFIPLFCSLRQAVQNIVVSTLPRC